MVKIDRNGNKPVLTLFTKEDCQLCDEALGNLTSFLYFRYFDHDFVIFGKLHCYQQEKSPHCNKKKFGQFWPWPLTCLNIQDYCCFFLIFFLSTLDNSCLEKLGDRLQQVQLEENTRTHIFCPFVNFFLSNNKK